jgi:hypothetical protein
MNSQKFKGRRWIFTIIYRVLRMLFMSENNLLLRGVNSFVITTILNLDAAQ